MRNDGKNLEKFVEKFHEVFRNENTTIEPRKKLYDEDGKLVAEIDILITDKISSIPVSIAIECRDRPSEGRQGVDWIQQIIGRRISFGFDKYIAVSSTGFTTPAIREAKNHNILLRSTSQFTDIVNDFSHIVFQFRYPRFQPTYPVRITTHNKFLKDNFVGTNDVQTTLFKKNFKDKYLTIFQFAMKYLPQYIDKESESWQNVIIDLPGDAYLKFKGKEFTVNHLKIYGLYCMDNMPAKTIGIKTFNEYNECLGQQVRIVPPYPCNSWVDFLFIYTNEGKFTFNILDSYFPSEYDIKYLRIDIPE